MQECFLFRVPPCPGGLGGALSGVFVPLHETAVAFAACVCVGLKPPSPLRARNGRFGADFWRRADVGFSVSLLWVSSGVAGFNVAMFLSPVREIFRPARPGVDESAKKFAQRAQNGPKSAFYGVLGEVFRGTAAKRAVPGEFFRGTAAKRAVPGEFFRGTAGPHGARVVSLQSLRPPLIPAMSSARQTCGASAVVVVTARR